MKIKTGVIGVGSMGKHHARIYSEVSNLVGVSDIDEALGNKISKKWNTKYFANYEDMLSSVDAVTVSVPTSFHSKVCEDVIQAGVHLLVEKPLASSVNESKKIMDAAKSANLRLAVGHIERFNPVISLAKEKLSRGEWGNIITLSAKRLSSYPERIRDVGVLFDLSIHDVDLIRFLANSNLDYISTIGGNYVNDSYEDHVFISMVFKSGILGSCETNWLSHKKVREINLITTTHNLKLDLLQQKIYVNSEKDYSTGSSLTSDNSYENVIQLEKKEPLKLELINFLKAVEIEANPLVTGVEGLEAVKIIEAASNSLSSNSVIKF